MKLIKPTQTIYFKREIRQQLSLLILSYNRKENIEKIIEIQSNYPEISEIIVLNNTPDYSLGFSNKKVSVLNSSVNFGLYSRFAMMMLARNPYIVWQDDDIILKRKHFRILYDKIRQDPQRMFGFWGRNCNDGYLPIDHYGESDVVITKGCILSKEMAGYINMEYAKYVNDYNNYLEEDILISVLAQKYKDKKPIAIKSDEFIYLKEENGQSHRPDHISSRNKAWQKHSKAFKI